MLIFGVPQKSHSLKGMVAVKASTKIDVSQIQELLHVALRDEKIHLRDVFMLSELGRRIAQVV